MDNITHDPSEYIKGLQQILISDKKRIGFLFGAGTSLAKKTDNSLTVPAIKQMTDEIVKEISEKSENLKKALSEIKNELTEKSFNIETLLSNLEQKYQIIGNGTLNDLKKEELFELIKEIKVRIIEKASVHKNASDEIIKNLVQTEFAEWIGQANRKYGIEIFTTNYDFLFELGLEYKNIPYYDGFTGSYEPFFYADSVEDMSYLSNQTKLWKIHGSLGWYLNPTQSKVIKKDSDKSNAIIFPSYLKYNNSKKQPYFSLMDRLYNFLKQDDGILIACGYSFGDEHINERIISALNTDTTSHIIALYYGEIEEGTPLYNLAIRNSKISAYGFRQAIIGCQYGRWQLKREPSKEDTIQVNTYFDEDAPFNINDELKEEKKGKEIWTGEGKFILPDFLKLTAFLKSMITTDFGRDEYAKQVDRNRGNR